MPYRRFDWHEHIAEVWGEFRSARAAIDRLRAAVDAAPDILITTASRASTFTSYLTSGADHAAVLGTTLRFSPRGLSPKERYFTPPGEHWSWADESCPKRVFAYLPRGLLPFR